MFCPGRWRSLAARFQCCRDRSTTGSSRRRRSSRDTSTELEDDVANRGVNARMSRNVFDLNDQRNMSRETKSICMQPQSVTSQRGVAKIAALVLAFVMAAAAFASLPAYAEDELPSRVG